MMEDKNELEEIQEQDTEPMEASAEVGMEAAEETESAAAEPETEVEATAEPEVTEKPKIQEMGNAMDYSDSMRSLSRGDLVDGVVVHIDREGVLVDVGTKSEGIIPPGELSNQHVESPEDVVKVGETIHVYVMETENEHGNPVLSKKRADFGKAWERVEQAFEDGKTLMAMVTDRVKGGLQVDLGIRGFVPGSHVGGGNVKSLERYVGQSLPLKVIEVDRERRKVVLSHRLAMEEQRGKQRTETMASLAEGQIREGVVRRITDYGAFVDLGGIDGLLHISEMSWSRITHPSTAVKVGQKLNVMILRLDPKSERVSLGIRQILPDPWAEIEDKYRIGDVVKGKVTRLVMSGAFVQLDEGIEAIIPNSELSHKRVKRPEEVVSVGDEVEIKIIDIRPEERRMTLSLRQLQEVKERKDFESYKPRDDFDSRMTLGHLIGDKLQNLVANGKAADEETEPEAVEAAEDGGEEVGAEAVTVEEAPAETAEEVAETEIVEEVTVAEVVVEAPPAKEPKKPAKKSKKKSE
ncbi:MAG TPA: 30S ribosomal protein S1 [Armatimonadota bacterium]|nr:30S ribosomal protein S1 [Armatimonadota bacterium]